MTTTSASAARTLSLPGEAAPESHDSRNPALASATSPEVVVTVGGGRRQRPARHEAPPAASTAAAIFELAKPGITRLVCITAGIGYVLALHGRAWSWGELAVSAGGCIAGTALSAAGANALNMWWEGERDARMHRTARRPIPAGVLAPGHAALAGWAFSLAGVLLLLFACGPVPALVSAFTIASYVWLYTPLKPVTAWATLVGAVPGALPPMIGWTAAAGIGSAWGESAWDSLARPGGWSLFALMFVWQIPHFLAIAWMHREDYERGGHKVLPLMDPSGRVTAWCIAVFAGALIPLTMLPAWVLPEQLSGVYIAIAGATGGAFLGLCARLLRERTRARARQVFFASIIHLPVLLAAIVVETGLRAISGRG